MWKRSVPNWCSNDVLRHWIGKERKAVFELEVGDVVRKTFLFLGRRDEPAMCGSGQSLIGVRMMY
ncbi:hypothetical protein ACTFOB_06345 [Bacillus cereus group sp. MYBK79-1]|uniref:hypothetical protein n=1 Tax=unclassified Bacillus cereus group TaxID=2750818 RepID=UPI003F792208